MVSRHAFPTYPSFSPSLIFIPIPQCPVIPGLVDVVHQVVTALPRDYDRAGRRRPVPVALYIIPEYNDALKHTFNFELDSALQLPPVRQKLGKLTMTDALHLSVNSIHINYSISAGLMSTSPHNNRQVAAAIRTSVKARAAELRPRCANHTAPAVNRWFI